MFLLPAEMPFNQDDRLPCVTELLIANHFPSL